MQESGYWCTVATMMALAVSRGQAPRPGPRCWASSWASSLPGSPGTSQIQQITDRRCVSSGQPTFHFLAKDRILPIARRRLKRYTLSFVGRPMPLSFVLGLLDSWGVNVVCCAADSWIRHAVQRVDVYDRPRRRPPGN